MRGRIQILFAFLAALLLGVSCSSWGRQQAAQSSQERGIRWLLEHQNPDGSWGGESDVGRPDEVYADGNIAGTAHVLIQAASALAGQALLEPAAKGDAGCLAAVNKLAAWQLAHPSPRRSAPAAFYNVWSCSYRLEFFCALLDSGLAPQRRGEILAAAQSDIERLLEVQAANGGFAYYDMDVQMSPATGSESTSFCSAVALRALLRAGRHGLKADAARLNGVAAMIRYCRLSDTAFAYGPSSATFANAGSTVYGAAGRTCLCHLALAETGDRDSAAALPAALEAYRKSHGAIMAGAGRNVPHQAPGAIAGYYTWFSHYYAMQSAAVARDLDSADWVAEKIVANQGPAGYWFDFPIPQVGRTYPTAFAVLALQEYARLRPGPGGY
ncbi:MAG: hypothetical protein RL095_3052 [Verrucomicrobiota bacterium]|jgi:hypothetical protein